MSKTKIEIIDETVEYIKENGRALQPNGVTCMYQNENGIGCAVGRCLDKKKYFSGMEENNVINLTECVLEKSLDHYLKKDYKGHSLEFWSDLQKLHDESCYWINNKELSSSGKAVVGSLKKKYTNEN